MGKLVFWILLIVVVWGGARFLTLMQRKNDAARTARLAREQRREPILRCEVCGVYVPASEAVKAGGKVYCSQGHRRDGA